MIVNDKNISGKIIDGRKNAFPGEVISDFLQENKNFFPKLEEFANQIFDKVKLGEKISVLLERIEDKNGEVLVSANKAQKIKGWYELEKAYEKNIPITGKIISK